MFSVVPPFDAASGLYVDSAVVLCLHEFQSGHQSQSVQSQSP